MDLPISRLPQANVLLIDGTITFKDMGYDSILLSLTPGAVRGEFAIAAKNTSDEVILYQVSTTYYYDHVNLRTLKDHLHTCLAPVGLKFIDIGLYYHQHGEAMIGSQKFSDLLY